MPIKRTKTASPKVVREVAESTAQTASQTSAIQTRTTGQMQQVASGLEAMEEQRDALVDRISDQIAALVDPNLIVRDAMVLAQQKLQGGASQVDPFLDLAGAFQMDYEVGGPLMLNEAPPQASNLLTAGDYE